MRREFTLLLFTCVAIAVPLQLGKTQNKQNKLKKLPIASLRAGSVGQYSINVAGSRNMTQLSPDALKNIPFVTHMTMSSDIIVIWPFSVYPSAPRLTTWEATQDLP